MTWRTKKQIEQRTIRRRADPNHKRHTARSPLNYLGGKRRGVSHIVPHFPPDLTEMVSPFFGGGGLEIEMAKRGVRVHGYDRDEGVTCFWTYVQRDPVRLHAEIRKLWPLGREQFHDLRRQLIEIPNSLQRAAYYYAVNKSSFMGQTYTGSFIGENYEFFHRRKLHAIRTFKLSKLTVERCDYRVGLESHPGLFAYLDPPYLMDFKGPGYYGPGGLLHSQFDHQALRDFVADRPRWIMSNCDNEMVRDLYAGFEMVVPVWAYGMGSGAPSRELLIFSKDLRPRGARASQHAVRALPPPASVAVAHRSPIAVLGAGKMEGLGRWDAVALTNPLFKEAEDAARKIGYVLDPTKPAETVAYLCGQPGLGKTNAIKAALAAAGLVGLFRKIANPNDLIAAFDEASDLGQPLILEESDSVFLSPGQVNILKLATDQAGRREITARLPEIDEDTGKSRTVVRTVSLTAPLIVTSNKDLRNPASFDKKMRDHIAALVSRSKPVYLGAAVPVQWEYACYLAICKGMIERPDEANLAPIAVQNAALEWFTVNLNRLADGSPRTLKEICKFISYNPGDRSVWERDLRPSLVNREAPDFRPPRGIMPKITETEGEA